MVLAHGIPVWLIPIAIAIWLWPLLVAAGFFALAWWAFARERIALGMVLLLPAFAFAAWGLLKFRDIF